MLIQILKWLLVVSGGVVGTVYFYKWIYFIIGLFKTRQFPKTNNYHRYAILIAARNEGKVLGNLLDSINAQDYHRLAPGKIDTFVIADNCTDNTKEIALTHGAKCYTRRDTEKCTKGYALQYLMEKIRMDYGIDSYDGYFVFDADNLLAEDYVTRMNESFDAGCKIVCSYRNTKNFSTNWISASYGFHYLRTIRNEHRARSFLRMSTRIQGTGFLVASEILRNGWNYTSLTEDRAFSADAVANGYDISYNHAAIFYDEQPVTFRIAMRQRIRWAKGNLQAFTEYGGKLLKGSFTAKGLHQKLRNLDMLLTIFPRQLVTAFRRIIIMSLEAYVLIANYNATGLVYALLYWMFKPFVKQYINAIYALIAEHRKVPRIVWYRKIWYIVMFPFFDIIGRIAILIALVRRVEWKPIPHEENIRLADIPLKNT